MSLSRPAALRQGPSYDPTGCDSGRPRTVRPPHLPRSSPWHRACPVWEPRASEIGSMHAGHRHRVADGGQTSVPRRRSRSVIDSVGPAGADFAPNADSVLEVCLMQLWCKVSISAIPARSPSELGRADWPCGSAVAEGWAAGFTDRCHTCSELRICGWRRNFAPYSPELCELAEVSAKAAARSLWPASAGHGSVLSA